MEGKYKYPDNEGSFEISPDQDGIATIVNKPHGNDNNYKHKLLSIPYEPTCNSVEHLGYHYIFHELANTEVLPGVMRHVTWEVTRGPTIYNCPRNTFSDYLAVVLAPG